MKDCLILDSKWMESICEEKYFKLELEYPQSLLSISQMSVKRNSYL